MALLYSTIFYFMVGLRGGADHFFVFFTTVLLIQLTVVSLATFAVSVFRDFANAAMVGFAIFGASQFAGGCFLPANKIPVYVSWMKWTSYIVRSRNLDLRHVQLTFNSTTHTVHLTTTSSQEDSLNAGTHLEFPNLGVTSSLELTSFGCQEYL
jgi:ABC-type transport system involved in multi-copper enzyme maturation permease subunit